MNGPRTRLKKAITLNAYELAAYDVFQEEWPSGDWTHVGRVAKHKREIWNESDNGKIRTSLKGHQTYWTSDSTYEEFRTRDEAVDAEVRSHEHSHERALEGEVS